MNQACFKKCIEKFHEEELAIGEMTCIDRCVIKYIQTQSKVAAVLQENQQKIAESQQQEQH
jgi:import inner membrane translocase subunit TIM10